MNWKDSVNDLWIRVDDYSYYTRQKYIKDYLVTNTKPAGKLIPDPFHSQMWLSATDFEWNGKNWKRERDGTVLTIIKGMD